MDFILDLNNKNWPAIYVNSLNGNQLSVTLGQYGFSALTNQLPGKGQAVLSGTKYTIHLPGEIQDHERLIVNFKLADE